MESPVGGLEAVGLVDADPGQFAACGRVRRRGRCALSASRSLMRAAVQTSRVTTGCCMVGSPGGWRCGTAARRARGEDEVSQCGEREGDERPAGVGRGGVGEAEAGEERGVCGDTRRGTGTRGDRGGGEGPGECFASGSAGWAEGWRGAGEPGEAECARASSRCSRTGSGALDSARCFTRFRPWFQPWSKPSRCSGDGAQGAVDEERRVAGPSGLRRYWTWLTAAKDIIMGP